MISVALQQMESPFAADLPGFLLLLLLLILLRSTETGVVQK